MKILLYTDPHFSQFSSIVRSRGQKYSKRLENLVRSINWAENLSFQEHCDMVVCLGDFFDTPTLNAEELTALQDIEWHSSIQHYFIVGNHESNVSSLEYSSTKALEKPFITIVDKDYTLDVEDNTNLVFIPYTLEENRKSIKEYLKEPHKNNIVLSHNDLLGIRYGKFESKEGFNIKEVEDCCDLFINGHLHNGCYINDKETILNLGNLTGQNFSEDANLYKHYACILDTKTNHIDFYENPFAFNFYKITIKSSKDYYKLNTLNDNAVVTFVCNEPLIDELREQLKAYTEHIVEYRIVVSREMITDTATEQEVITLNNLDYLEKFSEFILENVGDFDVCRQEISHIIQGGN